jgi:antitoxin component YwqK of YwqJK toxin-antitoxin module
LKKIFYTLTLILLITSSIFAQTDTTFHPNGDIAEIITKRNGIKTVSKYHSEYSYQEKKRKNYLQSKISYKGKKLHGNRILYFSNGLIKESGKYINGLSTGKHIKKNFKGEFQQEVNYTIITKNGRKTSVKHGKHLYFLKGKLSKSISYNKGKLDGFIEKYFANGNPESRKEYKNSEPSGEITKFYDNGEIKSRIFQRRNYKHKSILFPVYKYGTYEYNYRDGTPERRIVYKDGEKLSEKRYYKNGKLQSENRFYGFDLRNKETIAYDEIGVKNFHVFEYKQDLRFEKHGPYKRYLAGVLIEDGEYKNGKKVGEYLTYHKNGNLASRIHYKDGKIIGKSEHFFKDGDLKSLTERKDTKNWQRRNYMWKTGWSKDYYKKDSLYNHRPRMLTYYWKNKETFKSHFSYDGHYKSFLFEPTGTHINGYFYPNGNLKYISIRIAPFSQYSYFFVNKQNYHSKTYGIFDNEKGMNYFLTNKEEPFYAVEDEKNIHHNLDKHKTNGLFFQIKDTDLFNPKVKTSIDTLRNLNGDITLIIPRKDNLLDGKVTWYYPDGNIRFQGSYKDGLSHGIQFSLKENGDTLENHFYNNNIRVYSRKINDEQGLTFTQYDSVEKEIYRYEEQANGTPKRYDNFNEDVYISYFEDGKINTQYSPHPENKKWKEEKMYFSNGQLKSYVIRDRETKKKIKSQYAYFENGQLKFQWDYLSENEMFFTAYFENGRKKIAGKNINERKEGWWIENTEEEDIKNFYSGGILSKSDNQLIAENCFCTDTTDRFVPRYYNSLKSIVDYEDYEENNISYLKPLSEKDYRSIYIKNTMSSFTHRLHIKLFKPLKIDYFSTKKSSFTFNNCYTKGFWSNIYVSTTLLNGHKKFTIDDADIRLDLDVTKFEKLINQPYISFSFSPKEIIFDEHKGISTNRRSDDFCFDEFSIGSIGIKQSKGTIVGEKNWTLKEFKHQQAGFPKTEVDIAKKNLGVEFRNFDGELVIDNNQFVFKNSYLILTEKMIFGTGEIPLYVSNDKGDVQLLNSETEIYKTSINKIKDLLLKQGFMQVKITEARNGKSLKIEYYAL